MSALLDDAVGELRVAAGLPRVDLSLVATAVPLPPNVPELPPPTLRESIEQAFRAASVVDDPTERVSLLEAIVGSVAPEPASASEKELDVVTPQSGVGGAGPGVQNRPDIQRSRVSGHQHGRRAVKRADVGGIERLVASVLKTDDRLGRRRPQMTAALLATLDGRLDAARRLRLARDAWALRRDALVDYQQRIRAATNGCAAPSPASSKSASCRGRSPMCDAADGARHRRVEGTEERPVPGRGRRDPQHVGQRRAARHSRRLVSAARDHGVDMNKAWEASAAAAGALLMLERAQEDLRKLMTPPGL